MSKSQYRKLSGTPGVYKHDKTSHYMARKKIKGVEFQETFATLFEAKQWRKNFDGVKTEKENSSFSTLAEVWQKMQEVHFPMLATTTRTMWLRRYQAWKTIEHLPMDHITPSKITTWVNHLVQFYKSDAYDSSRRGKAQRCNLNNELNLFVTIFNWYKESEEFEKEALHLTNPIKRKHKQLGFIKPLPDKKKQIDLDDAFTFFDHLQPLYRDLAQMQFYTAGRIGEVAGLQWENVDLKNRRMLIKHTCIWCMSHKTYQELKPFPKNKEARVCYITDEILEILMRRKAFKENSFVFHVEGAPLNYCTIQLNYRSAQRKSGIPYTGTHILRHGMAKLARKVGGGLDAVMAMTGHKDIKLADHYSKCDEDDQKDVSEKVMQHIRSHHDGERLNFSNVVSLIELKRAKKV
ncbi:MAG: tyrosine-type recombinase/integrase [Bacteriovoracaceae bacterium]|nr:tyrosine-type recombinase/integrase [Bacteriovoracaceae bacterium]